MSDLSNLPTGPGRASTPQSLACAFCKRPIQDTYYQMGPRPCCPACATQVQALREKNEFDAAAWIQGALLGLAAALGGGLAWAIVAKMAHVELGILAVGIGWIVCAAVRQASGGRRGNSFRSLAMGLAIIGILAGKILTIILLALDRFTFPQTIQIAIRIISTEPQMLFTVFDLLWVIIAMLQPYRAFKPIQVDLRGPFGRDSAPSDHLQFDRVELPQPTGSPPGER